MKFFSGEIAAGYIEGLVYAKKQVRGVCVDLTVKKILELDRGGAADFGGSEYAPASWKDIPPAKKSPEDKYGWWTLSGGMYMVVYNEVLKFTGDQIAFITPHLRFIRAGGTHPSYIASSGGELSLIITAASGLRIKENSRISELRVAARVS